MRQWDTATKIQYFSSVNVCMRDSSSCVLNGSFSTRRWCRKRRNNTNFSTEDGFTVFLRNIGTQPEDYTTQYFNPEYGNSTFLRNAGLQVEGCTLRHLNSVEGGGMFVYNDENILLGSTFKPEDGDSTTSKMLVYNQTTAGRILSAVNIQKACLFETSVCKT
jgi:hypothetical protein